MAVIRRKVSAGGRVVIPAEIRAALGLEAGDTVLWELKDGAAILTTRRARLRRVQALARRYLEPGESSVDEFIAERRREAERE